MTSVQLEAIRKRLDKLQIDDDSPTIWIDFDYNIIPLIKDATALLAAVDEQQKELEFLRAAVHDLSEESDAVKEVVKLRKEKEKAASDKNAGELLGAMESILNLASRYGAGF